MKKTITYERVVLTIIAGLLFLNFLEVRYNQTQFEPNKLSAKFASWDSTIKDFAIVPVNDDGSIDVRIKGSAETLDVNIEEVSTSDKLNVNLKSSDSYSLNYTGPIEVKIKE